MTATKVAYLIAVVVPFGFVILAACFALRVMLARRRAYRSAAVN